MNKLTRAEIVDSVGAATKRKAELEQRIQSIEGWWLAQMHKTRPDLDQQLTDCSTELRGLTEFLDGVRSRL